MKKIISVVLSIAMLVAVSALAFNAFADTVLSPQKKPDITVTVTVNGKPNPDAKVDRDKDNDRKITFTYTGSGKFIKWEFPGMVEGKDYTIIDGDINSKTITILVSDTYGGDVIGNAVVDESGKKPDGGSKSPGTGALAAAGIAAMGAGAAIIAAARKKRD